MSDKPASSANPDATAPVPASPPEKPVSKTHHGVTLTDPYDWLRDPDYPTVETPEILDHLKAENAYFEACMAPLEGLIENLFQEMKGRIKDDDASVPVRDGGYEYWRRFDEGAEYRTWLRRPVQGGADEVILDENALAEGHVYFNVRAVEVDRSARLLAWSSDTDGSERYTIRIKSLADGTVVDDTVTNTSGSVVWNASGTHFLYVELSDQLRPFRVRAHRLGDDPQNDRVLYEEADTSFFVGIGEGLSRRFIEIGAGDHVTSEIRLLPADDINADPVLIAERDPGHEYDVVDDGETGRLFIRSNRGHQNFRLMQATLDAPGEADWQPALPAEKDVYLRGVTAFRDFLVLQERVAGIDRIRILDKTADGVSESHVVAFEETVYTAGLGENAEFDTGVIRLGYTSMITPATVYDYAVRDRRLTVRKVQEIPSGYDKSLYRTERLTARARDGAEVPVSILYRADRPRDGAQPMHLYAYGAYGMGMPPGFSTARLSLVDRGFAYAIAHIRGGDEMGRDWYEAGKLMARRNTFNDFIDCARFLEDEGYAAPGGISISGGSAGGTLMGVVLNEAPELWKAAVAHVPFVDVMNTMLDETLPLTPIEWPEWGNPIADKQAFDYILSYSPYENVRKQDYPPILITAGLSDPRVTYWEPAKWAARLRASKTDSNLLLLKTNMGAGHGGKSGRYESLYETAEEFAFILMAFGLAGGAD